MRLEPVLLVLFIGGFLALVIWANLYARRQKRERAEALTRLAARHGWTYHGDDEDHVFERRYPHFGWFQKGDDDHRYAFNRLTGTIRAFDYELPVRAGDYHYRVTSGSGKNKSSRVYEFSFLIVTLPFGPLLPALRVRPETLFDKLAGAVGFEDIDFESAEFSRRHHVSASDRRFAYALLDPRMIGFLVDLNSPVFELGRGDLLVISKGGEDRWDEAEFVGAVDWTLDFLDRWPAHLVTDLLAQRPTR